MKLRLSCWLLASSLALGACNLSDVGKSQQPPPVAVAGTVGQPYTVDGSGVLHTSVRAGADVVLTGVNSHSGNDQNGAPIISFAWQQQAASGSPTVDLVNRTNNTISFTAPEVTQATALTFQLTVKDAAGASATAQAQVAIQPARDPDRFLSFLSVPDEVTVTATTNVPVSADTNAPYNAPIPYAITVIKLVTYTDTSGTVHSQIPVGQAVTYHGSWSAALGTGTGCADARNPQILVPIPRLNLDDLLNDGSGHRLSDVMQTSDLGLDPPNQQIPPAGVYAQVEIAPDPSAPAPAGVTPGSLQGATPLVCVGSAGSVGTVLSVNNPSSIGGPVASVTFSSDDALAKIAPPGLYTDSDSGYDSSASAHAYYQTIDPTNAKTTLADWLQANGLDRSAPNWGADTHAVYTNNFDLGLGRDMYLKVGACDSGYSAMPLSQFAAQTPLAPAAATQLQQLVGHCDVAAVVVNYVGLQAAAQHLNAIAAVAMEYSAAPGTGSRFVKFYVFAPDTRTGAMERVTSVDLDHRGQRNVPEACVVCHGGTPGKVSTDSSGISSYFSGGDLNTGFLPWDLDSLLYSDTDPGFSQKAEDAALKGQYTRAAQLASLKLLNVGAYLTMADPARFGLERELLEGWYGGPGLPGAYSGSFVPPGWQSGGPDGNPTDSASLYSNVFARDCRMCHIAQAPAVGISLIPSSAGGTNGSGTASCAQATTDAGIGSNDQYPMGCYWQFANAPLLAQVTGDGEMPLARRTADRMWSQPDGSATAGAVLQAHFAAQTPGVSISTPGTSVATITPPAAAANPCGVTSVGGVPSVDIGDLVRLDASASWFPDVLSWSVNACTGTPGAPGQCTTPVPVSGSSSLSAGFVPGNTGTYQVAVALDGGQGSATASYYVPVPVCQATFAPASSIPLTVGVPALYSLNPTLIANYGNGGQANSYVLLQPADPTLLQVTPAACAQSPGCAVNGVPGGKVSLTWIGSSAGQTSLTIAVGSIAGGGASPSETITVTGQAAIQAPPEFAIAQPIVRSNSGQADFALLNDIENAAASTFPNCQTVQVQNVQYLGPRAPLAASYDQTTQTLTYSPQAGFATYGSDGTKQALCGLNDGACEQERFSYDLICTLSNGPTQTASGHFDIPVLAEVSISDAENDWLSGMAPGGTCDSCHNGTTAPDFGHALDSLKTGSLSLLSSTPYVNFGSVDSSGLLCWPEETCTAGTTTHTGGLVNSSALGAVRIWILDGANPF